jgi:4a-hydroxytetrahydrobiopterin dehydratase
MASDLASRHCVPCDGSVPKLGPGDVDVLAAQLPGWRVADQRLHGRFVFDDFVRAMGFVNRMADVAESEGHHPDFTVHYREVDVVVWTHAVGGLTENDFILAAKIDAVARESGARSGRGE